MSDFNYQKGYCVLALPAFNAFNAKQKELFDSLYLLVADLQQGRDLNIPLSEEMEHLFTGLSDREIAEVSRASYFVGHWQPGLVERPFDNTKGQSWKVANICDQVLRTRLMPFRTLEVHEGKLRVTFSSKDCWLYEEFALATAENVQKFKDCGLPFGENSLSDSAKQLAGEIGDLWPSPDDASDNDIYLHFLEEKKKANLAKIEKQFKNKIAKLNKDIENAQKEKNFLNYCVKRNVPVDNVIYYTHTGKFCFGWRDTVSKPEAHRIRMKLNKPSGCPYAVEFKTQP